MADIRFQMLEQARYTDGGSELVAALTDALRGYGVSVSDTQGDRGTVGVVVASDDSAGLAELDAFLTSGSSLVADISRLLLIASGNPAGTLTHQMRGLSPVVLASNTLGSTAAGLLSELLLQSRKVTHSGDAAKPDATSTLLRAMNAMVTSRVTELEIVQELYASRDPQNRLTQDLELLRHCRAELDELLEG